MSYYGPLLILVGLLNGFYAIRFLTNATFAQEYALKSPKAALWRKLFGEEKAVKVIRNVFAPFSIVLSLAFIGSGIYLILNPGVIA